MNTQNFERSARNDLIAFRDEELAPPARLDHAWRILAVDDDESFQRTMALALKGAVILNRPIELVQAYSLAEAAALLGDDGNFAVIVADVVMETEDAGLRLVKGIREMLGLFEPRIVLLTGQPGLAPVERVIEEYDLTDYCLKSDLAHRGLKNVLTAAIRSYKHLSAVTAARRGLQLILESSNKLATARTLKEMSSGVLTEFANLLHVPNEGIVCVWSDGTPAAAPVIIGAAGRFEPHINAPLDTLPDAGIRELIRAALERRSSLQHDDCQVIHFSQDQALADYAVYLDTGRPLEESEHELLQVFSANASKGFGNVALISRLDRLAFEDELLKIPNRSALLREIERLRLQNGGHGMTLALIDLDNFAGLNDAFGVALGNRILKAMHEPLRRAFPPPAFIARITADLFAVLGDAASVNMATARTVLDEPLAVDTARYRMTACCTEIALDAVPGDASELLRAARGGMRAAKSRGPSSAAAYDPEFEHRAAQRFDLMLQLAEAIEREELVLLFQPQIELATGRVIGAEGLLRWQHNGTFVPPDEFIPIAEQSSYINAIGEFVLKRACIALQALEQADLADLLISINVSAREFESPTLAASIADACRVAGIASHRLGLEVTETAVMSSFDTVVGALESHRDLGGCVAIDDFGTGMSSLEYLLHLPADHLKIDRTFVCRLDTDERSQRIAKMIIDLGRAIGVKLIAEGVETQAQAKWLRQQGCHIGQGWLFARAMPLDALIAFCRERGR